jgi:hypothetical protein
MKRIKSRLKAGTNNNKKKKEAKKLEQIILSLEPIYSPEQILHIKEARNSNKIFAYIINFSKMDKC